MRPQDSVGGAADSIAVHTNNRDITHAVLSADDSGLAGPTLIQIHILRWDCWSWIFEATNCGAANSP